MFEKSPSLDRAASAPAGQSTGELPALPLRRGDTALKAIEWCDLAARLEAARDLRLALRHEARRHIEDTAASFSDAAAQYFRTLEQSKQPVNLGSLDDHKGSAPIVPDVEAGTATAALPAGFSRDDAKDEQ
jgi:hypothetical protein